MMDVSEDLYPSHDNRTVDAPLGGAQIRPYQQCDRAPDRADGSASVAGAAATPSARQLGSSTDSCSEPILVSMKLAGPLPLRITRRNDGDCRGNYAEELCRCSVVGAMVSNVIDLRMEQRCSGIFRGQGREFRWADLVLVFSVPGEQQIG